MNKGEIGPRAAEAILGCEINCGHWGGPHLGCEYYTHEQMVKIINDAIKNNRSVFKCPDGVIEVGIREAIDMINQQ